MKQRLDILLIGVSLVVVSLVVGCLYVQPDASQVVANKIQSVMIDVFGSTTLLFTFLGLLLLVGISISKYGKIRLGNEEPKYSTFKWVAMMISCGAGSGTCYWAFIE